MSDCRGTAAALDEQEALHFETIGGISTRRFMVESFPSFYFPNVREGEATCSL